MVPLVFQESISGSIKDDGNVLIVNKLYVLYDVETETLQRLVVTTNNRTFLLDKRQVRRSIFQERNTCKRITDNEVAAKVRSLFV